MRMEYSYTEVTIRTLTPLSCRVVKNNIYLFTIHGARMLTIFSNKINGFCGLDFVAWISFAAWILVL